MPNFDQILKLGSNEDQFFSVTNGKIDFFEKQFQKIFINAIVEILKFICGFESIVLNQNIDKPLIQKFNYESSNDIVFNEDIIRTSQISYIIKFRIKHESLLYFASILKQGLALKFQGLQEINVINQQFNKISDKELINLNYEKKNFKNKKLSIYDLFQKNIEEKIDRIKLDTFIVNRTKKIDKKYKTQDNPQSNFLQSYPYYTTHLVNNRINPKMATQIYLNQPFKFDSNIINIKHDYAKLLPSDNIQRNQIDKMEQLENEMANSNPYMTDLYNFSFGISDDCPDIYKIFPQDLRIDMCSDIINDELNLKYLSNIGLVQSQDGLHHIQDKVVIIENLARFDKMFHELSRKDLLIIKHQWGTEIASQFMFLNFFTQKLYQLACIGSLSQIIIIIFNIFYPIFQIVIIRLIFGFITIIFGINFQNEQKQKEKLQLKLWGCLKQSNDSIRIELDKLEDFNKSKITSQFSNVQFNPISRIYQFKSTQINIQRIINGIIMFMLFILITQVVGFILYYKNKNQGTIYGTLLGLSVLVSIKIIQGFWYLTTQLLSDLENYQQKSELVASLAYKNYIFQQFNLFYNFQQILYQQKQGLGIPCFKIEVLDSNSNKIIMESCMIELENQIWINILFQFVYNPVEIATPQLINKLLEYLYPTQMQDRLHSHKLKQKQSASNDCNKYSIDDLTDEQTEIIIQVTMLYTFGQSYPLAALWLYLSFLFEIRLDLYKFVHLQRRGSCSSTKGIGAWYRIMDIVTQLAVFNNLTVVILEIQQFDNQSIQLSDQKRQYFMVQFQMNSDNVFIVQIILQQIALLIIYLFRIHDQEIIEQSNKINKLFKYVRKEVDQNLYDKQDLFICNDKNDLDTEYTNENDYQLIKNELEMEFGEFWFKDEEFDLQ